MAEEKETIFETLQEDCVYLILKYLTTIDLRRLERAVPSIKEISGYDALKKRKFIIGHPHYHISSEDLTTRDIDRHYESYEYSAERGFYDW